MSVPVPDDVRRHWDVAFFGVRDPEIEKQQRAELARMLYLQNSIDLAQLQLWRALGKI
jgi:hypothetical protein